MHIGLNTSDIYIRCSKNIYEQSAHHGGGRWGESPPLVNPLIKYPGKGLMVSRVVWDHEVAGSTPATRTIDKTKIFQYN